MRFLLAFCVISPVLLSACKPRQDDASQSKDVGEVVFGGNDASGNKQCTVICAAGCINDDAEGSDRKTMACSAALDPQLETKLCTKSTTTRKCTPNGTPGTGTGDNGGGSSTGGGSGGGSNIQPECETPLPARVAKYKIVTEAGVESEQFCDAFVPMFDDFLAKRPQVEKLLESGGAAKKPVSIVVLASSNVGYDRKTFHKLEVFWNLDEIKSSVDDKLSTSLNTICGGAQANQWCDAFRNPPLLWTYVEQKVKGLNAVCPGNAQVVSRQVYEASMEQITNPDTNRNFGAKLRAEPFVWSGAAQNTSSSTTTGQAPCTESTTTTRRPGLKPTTAAESQFTLRSVTTGQRVKAGLQFTCEPINFSSEGSDVFPTLCFTPIVAN